MDVPELGRRAFANSVNVNGVPAESNSAVSSRYSDRARMLPITNEYVKAVPRVVVLSGACGWHRTESEAGMPRGSKAPRLSWDCAHATDAPATARTTDTINARLAIICNWLARRLGGKNVLTCRNDLAKAVRVEDKVIVTYPSI